MNVFRNGYSRVGLLVLLVGAIGLLAACRGGGANPGTVVIPVIKPTASTSGCLNPGYPAEAVQFGDNASIAYSEMDVTYALGTAKLKYFDHVVGDGASPASESVVKVFYTGWISSSCIFDYALPDAEPIQFRLSDVIPGWSQGLLSMKVGGRRRLEIPSELGYGPIGFPPLIPQSATLYFEVELAGVMTQAEAEATASVQSTAIAEEANATATARSATATALAPSATAAATPGSGQ